jgi:methylated-DNA-protein-cysteine methyltransferase-like protein
MRKEEDKKESSKKKAGKSFSERVVEAALSIPPGKVTTYGRLARACGAGPMASQSITSILGRAWESGKKNIPFHRIVYADGRIWTSGERDAKRMKLYKKEGIEIDEKGKIKDFEEKLFEFL